VSCKGPPEPPTEEEISAHEGNSRHSQITYAAVAAVLFALGVFCKGPPEPPTEEEVAAQVGISNCLVAAVLSR
jgi:hypothetical protein